MFTVPKTVTHEIVTETLHMIVTNNQPRYTTAKVLITLNQKEELFESFRYSRSKYSGRDQRIDNTTQ